VRDCCFSPYYDAGWIEKDSGLRARFLVRRWNGMPIIHGRHSDGLSPAAMNLFPLSVHPRDNLPHISQKPFLLDLPINGTLFVKAGK
jgi:hypothetical protein